MYKDIIIITYVRLNLKALKNLARLRNVMKIGKIQFAKKILEKKLNLSVLEGQELKDINFHTHRLSAVL